MGHLRLLYCDSAGVRRCRVLVCDGETPTAAVLATPAQTAVQGQPSLEVTPSIALAAGAGVLAAPARALQPSKSLGRVSEDRVLSPEASEEQIAYMQKHIEQQQEQQQQQQAASGSTSVSGSATPTLPKLGSFTTAPGLTPSPSMILAAAAGAIATPPGTDIPQFASNGSLDELAGLSAVSDYNQNQQLNSQPSATAGVGNLSPTPSMSLAAAAGAITLGGGSANSSRHQSPSRLGPSAAAVMGSPLQQQPQQQPLSKLSPAKPRPLISAFLKSPLSITGGAIAPATVAAAVNYSIGLTKACMGQPAFADLVVESSGLAPVGEVLIVPDLAAAVPWVGQPGDIMAPVDMVERDLSQPWSCCPRSALKRALSSLESRFGLTLMAGFELEFVLLKPAPLELFRVFPEAAKDANVMLPGGQAWVPFDETIYGQASAMSPSAMAVLKDVVSSLQEIGIGIVQYHPEAAPGQFEVVLSPFPALEAADKLLLAREVVSTVVGRHGLAVTWLPKPMTGHAGSGCHLHMSLRRNGESIMADAAAAVAGAASNLPPASYPLSSTANSFLAGVLDHLPGLLPFTAPSVNSYDRLKPCAWSGAFVCWGYDNREAPLRVCCPRGGPQGANAEFKAFDGTTNPYIGLAAVVAAGILGLEDGARLPAPFQSDPGSSHNARLAGSMQKLPTSLAQALNGWDTDTKLQGVMHSVLGSDLIKAFIAVRHCEAQENPKPETLLLRY